MSNKSSISTLLLLLQLDSEHLYHRLTDRQADYITEYSLKRTRDHFAAIFFTRYYTLTPQDLLPISGDLLIALDRFYNGVEELHWYVMHTQDMTTAFSDHIALALKGIAKHYQMLQLHLTAELRTKEENHQPSAMT